MKPEPTDEGKAIVKAYVNERIRTLWTSCAMDYAEMFTMSFLDSVMPMGEQTRKSANDEYDSISKKFLDFIFAVLENFYSGLDDIIQKAEEIINNWDYDEGVVLNLLRGLLDKYDYSWFDFEHRQSIQTKLWKIEKTGRNKYTFLSEADEKSCSRCGMLNGQTFLISEAKEGINLPLMHPNCRCTIEEFPLSPGRPGLTIRFVIALVTSLYNSHSKLEAFAKESAITVSGIIWSEKIGNNIWNTYHANDKVMIDETEYRVNGEGFKAVAVDQSGKIVGDNAKPYDAALLNMMKYRDSLPKGSKERMRVIREINEMTEMLKILAPSGEKLYSVSTKRSYDYYVIYDVTQKLNDYMRQAEEDYEYMHLRKWIDNLTDFYMLVKSKGKMDLKSQPEWQHSAFIYDGELVDKDALGNINYGYFGKHCNIPEIIMVSAAGAAQIMDNIDDDSLYDYINDHKRDIVAFFDEPRDAYRILQGEEIYNRTH